MTIQPEQVPEILRELEPYFTQIVEVQLKDYGEGANPGAWVCFRLPDPDCLAVYRGKDRTGRNAKVGKRYTLMLIEINDDEVPMESENPEMKQPRPYKLSQIAGMMCADEQFRHWITKNYGEPCHDKDQAAEFIREACGVESRSQLDSNESAAEIFRDILKAYDEFKKEPA